jgi:hypothetical protein
VLSNQQKNQPHRSNAAVEVKPADFSVSLEESSIDQEFWVGDLSRFGISCF